MIESEVTLLPQPDSPTIPSVSPWPTWKRDVVDRVNHAGASEELGFQVPDFEYRSVGDSCASCVHRLTDVSDLVIALGIERVTQTVTKEGEPEHRQTDREDREHQHVRIRPNDSRAGWRYRPSGPSSPAAGECRRRRS